MMSKLFTLAWALPVLCLFCTAMGAQEKTLVYYNAHETEILPDAQAAFREGNYERAARLCDWYFIVVGDTQAQALRETALKCAFLSVKMTVMAEEGQEDVVRETARDLLAINPDDRKAPEYLPAGNMLNGHEWVDLGLSVKWAACNIGASFPEMPGDYFAWGETSPSSEYSWSTYKWCHGSYDTQMKYISKKGYGPIDDKIVLELSDDAARVNWGGTWRLPTRAEIEELQKKCTWTATTREGKKGYLVTSKTNGNSIFLPATGYREGTVLKDDLSMGRYWSSSLDTYSPSGAYGLYFFKPLIEVSGASRGEGLCIRPVSK